MLAGDRRDRRAAAPVGDHRRRPARRRGRVRRPGGGAGGRRPARPLLRAGVARQLELPLLSAGRRGRLSGVRRLRRRCTSGGDRLQPRHRARLLRHRKDAVSGATSACWQRCSSRSAGTPCCWAGWRCSTRRSCSCSRCRCCALRNGSRPAGTCGCTRSRRCSALTIQAKVTGVLVLVIALNYLLVSKELRRLSVRRVLIAGRSVHRVLHPGAGADRAEVATSCSSSSGTAVTG